MGIPATGGWQEWTTITRPGAVFEAGVHYLQVFEENGGFNIDKIEILPQSHSSSEAGPASDQNDFRVYPNPALSSIKIEYRSGPSAPVQFEIYDMRGRLVQSGSENSGSGANPIEIDVTHWTSGNYCIKLIRNHIVKTDRLLVVK